MPKNTNIKSKRGFTIIEVVLVLAVAGLIFLMVFIALPALQRSQRDTQRRNDYGMLSGAVTSYSASNGGKIYRLANANAIGNDACMTLNPETYINKEGTDPNGYPYQLIACTWTGWETNYGDGTVLSDTTGVAGGATTMGSQVFVVIGADCTGLANGHDVPAANSSSRAFAIYGYIESGSQTYCSASQ